VRSAPWARCAMLRPCRAFSVICRPPKLTVRCTVTLVRLISPDSDPEILAIVAMLEAHEIPCFVRGGGFGGLYPGVQINAFNTRDIMVPEEHAAAALDLVRDFEVQPSAPSEDPQPKPKGRLRNLVELLLFGWFIPASRPGRNKPTTGTPNQRLERP
jgi:Putative prokaryotic signal transducing protein